MAKQSFVSVPILPSVGAVFDEFLTQKEISKTAALTDLVEMWMLATDEQLYLRLKKQHLKVEEARKMLAVKNDYSGEDRLSDTFLFMKLGIAIDKSGREYDGYRTLNEYIKDEKTRGYTWFSTDSLYFGMAKRQVSYFKKAICQGLIVKMLFVIGRDGGKNDIEYSAMVEDIVSYQEPGRCPEPGAFPKIWGDNARIWIKIEDIKEDTTLSVADLKIKSTGSRLKEVISNSQFHFGYVTKI